MERIERAKSNIWRKKFYDSNELKDFCKNFKVGGPMKCYSFNKEWNHPEYIKLFSSKNNHSNRFNREIDWRTRFRKNIVIAIFGETGSGKSLVAQTIALMWINLFKKNLKSGKLLDSVPKDILDNLKRNDLPKAGFSFSDPEFLKHISNMGYGDIEIRDETPRMSGTGKRVTIEAILNILDEVRAHQNSFIIVSPDLNQLIKTSAVHFYLRTAGINYDTRQTRLIIYEPIVTFSGNTKLQPTGRIILTIHNDDVLTEEYNRLKDKNIKTVKNTRGKVGKAGFGGVNERAEEQVRALIKICKKHDWRTKEDIKRLGIEVHNRVMKRTDQSNMIVGGSTNEVEDIIHRVATYFKDEDPDNVDVINKYVKQEMNTTVTPDDLEQQSEIQRIKSEKFVKAVMDLKLGTFLYDTNQVIRLLKVRKQSELKGRTLERFLRNLQWYKLYKNEVEQQEIAKRYKVHAGTVSANISRITGKIARQKGIMYEKFVAKKLKECGIFDTVKLLGGVNEPDILAYSGDNLAVISVKNDGTYNTRSKIELKKCANAEVEYARMVNSDYNTYVFLLYYNPEYQDNRIIHVEDYTDENIKYVTLH